MRYDPVIAEACRRCVASLKPEEYLGTVEVGPVSWDVYVHRVRPGAFDALRKRTGNPVEDAVTVAVRIVVIDGEKHAEVGTFLPGALTLAQVSKGLHRAKA